jgi:AcrR family transcriptional regulator
MSAAEPPAEASHRLRKKRQTRERILANAIALFVRDGIRKTRSAAIARASGISPATLFNYFSTKNDLVEAWVRGEIRACLEEVAAAVGESGLRPGFRSACLRLAEQSCAERDLRMEAWRHTARAAGDAFHPSEILVHVITREQARKRVRADLAAAPLAEILGEAIEGGLIAGLRVSKEPIQVAAMIRERVDLVLDGARKRSERVAAPAR